MEVTVEERCYSIIGRNFALVLKTRSRPAKSMGIELLDRNITH